MKIKKSLPRPKITLNRFGQIIFTLGEVFKLSYKIRPKLFVSVIIFNTLWGFSSVPGFYLEKLIIDKLISGVGSLDWQPIFYSVLWFTFLALLLSFISNFLGSLSHFLRENLSRYFDAEIDMRIGQKMAELPLSTIEDPDFKNRFDKVQKESGRRAWGLMMPISDIPNYVAGFLTATAVLVLVHPLVSVGVIVVSLPRFFINSKFIKKEYELHTELSPKNRIWGWISYYLWRNKNFMELKILNISEYLRQKMKTIVGEVLTKREKLRKKREFTSILGYLPLSLYELGISVFLIFWVIVGNITVGSFQLYLRSLRSAEQNLTGLVSSFLEVYENYIYVTDLVWFLNLDPETPDPGSKQKVADRIVIKSKDLWFRYKKGNEWILKDVNFKISPGEKIAIVGENGAGKSTLLKLLAGFYFPQKGSVEVSGMKVADLDLNNWRSKLTVLFQEFELYPFSVQEAIGYGDVKRINDMDNIKDVARKTGINEFIENLPLKYQNPLAAEFENGISPSIGQYQRLGISRVLFRKNAKVLVLDEPTSNVDPEAEEKIFQELVRIAKDKILIFVTQRFSTVRIADRIFVIDKGRIVEQGTHVELMGINGKYARLYNLQAKAYNS
jgi:ATP-binding cassette, subfamily B, bacterial